MPAGKELTSAAIAPGSLPYGERGALESNLPTASPAGAGPVANPAGARSAAVGPSSTPLERLLSGAAPSQGDLTAGLSLGAPSAAPVTPNPLVDRLRALATGANTPRVRALARSALRRMAAQGDL